MMLALLFVVATALGIVFSILKDKPIAEESYEVSNPTPVATPEDYAMLGLAKPLEQQMYDNPIKEDESQCNDSTCSLCEEALDPEKFLLQFDKKYVKKAKKSKKKPKNKAKKKSTVKVNGVQYKMSVDPSEPDWTIFNQSKKKKSKKKKSKKPKKHK